MARRSNTQPAERIENKPLNQIKPYAQNPRTHTDEQIELLASLMQRYGIDQPIVVDEKGVILKGHGRLLAAVKAGFKTFPVVTHRRLSEDDKRAIRIADNQIALLAGWDRELIKLELTELKLHGFELPMLGFDAAELAFFIDSSGGASDPERAPEPPKNPVSKPDDLWHLGGHRLLCGDATKADDVGKLLAGKKPHLMVTDPPYGVAYDPAWRDRELKTWKKPKSVGIVSNDDRSDWRDAWALFPGDVTYCWHPSGRDQLVHWQALIACGFDVRMQIVWVKPHYPIGRGNYHVQHEPCVYAVRKGATAHWQGARDQSTVWHIDNASAFHGSRGVGDECTGHSTQKPIECMKRPIDNNSKAGDLVYDPFVGSGTTVIACEMTGRKCLAIELSPAYCDVTIERWQLFAEKAATLAQGGRTFEQIKAERLGKAKRKAAPARARAASGRGVSGGASL